MTSRTVAVVQPYLPSYRLPFFERLVDRAARRDIRIHVYAADPVAGQEQRNDAVDVSGLAWATRVELAWRKVAGHWIRYYRLPRELQAANAVVVELASGCLTTTRLAVRGRLSRRSPAVVTWGQVVSGDPGPQPFLDRMMEALQGRASRAVLVYTEAGAEQARAMNMRAESIFVLQNTVDTSALQQAVASMSTGEARSIVAVDLPDPRHVLGYIGGLDAVKRIDLLVETVRRLHVEVPSVRLLVGGSGSDLPLLRDLIDAGVAVHLGRVGLQEKAAMSKLCRLLFNPGRVGLLAVESFVLGLPIVTNAAASHAPETEYLTFGANSELVDADPASAARGLQLLLEDADRLDDLRAGAARRSGWPSLDHMADTFMDGVEHALGVAQR